MTVPVLSRDLSEPVSAINPTGMFGQVMLVTPDMAQKWLATMPVDEQRHCRPNRLASYIRSRRADLWTLHHQGLGFDTEGHLRDGQHRLRMIVETGLPTVLFVVRNVPKESFLHVDEQMPRTIRDAIRMAGKGDYEHSEIAVARVLLDYPRKEATGFFVSKEVVLSRLRRWADSLDFAESHFPRVKGLTRSVRALVARAHAVLNETQQERLAQWCQVLRDGVPVSESYQEDTAAITYRNFLMAFVSAHSSAEVEKYRKGQTALQHFLRRAPMSRCYGTEKDLFPVPDGLADVEAVENNRTDDLGV